MVDDHTTSTIQTVEIVEMPFETVDETVQISEKKVIETIQTVGDQQSAPTQTRIETIVTEIHTPKAHTTNVTETTIETRSIEVHTQKSASTVQSSQ